MKPRHLLLLTAAVAFSVAVVGAFAQSRTGDDAGKRDQDQSQSSNPSDPERKAQRRAANEAAAKQRKADEARGKKAGREDEEEERKP
ncbi:hypothetical protein [Pseudoxanthomonas putridarboris]|uniref:Uncharacterized protein n=1 Tax=Pseudoxanthomonas putridarboris TaxID=752605 RepID=A0ABU9J1U6_9GAMM